jgi:hypothetical protein
MQMRKNHKRECSFPALKELQSGLTPIGEHTVCESNLATSRLAAQQKNLHCPATLEKAGTVRGAVNPPNAVAVLHTAVPAVFGMNTTWYYSYGLDFSISLIANSLSCAWRLTSGSLREGLRYLSNFYRLGRARGLPFVLEDFMYRQPPPAVQPSQARQLILRPQREPIGCVLFDCTT